MASCDMTRETARLSPVELRAMLVAEFGACFTLHKRTAMVWVSAATAR